MIMGYFSVDKVDSGIWRIWEKKNVGVAEYVIVGDEKALLIDTGYGGKGLKELIRKEVTRLPLIVVNSHYHPDHSADNGCFGTVYINGRDIPVDGESDFGRLMKKVGDGFAPAGKILDSAFPPFDDSKVNYIPMSDGDTFELGGRTVTVHEFPGHTRGSVMFTDSKTKALFTNDSCNNSTWLFTDPDVKSGEYAERVSALCDKFRDIEKVYYSHLKKTTGTDYFEKYGAFMKNLSKAPKIVIPLKGLDSPLCIGFGKAKGYGIVCSFFFRNQIQ